MDDKNQTTPTRSLVDDKLKEEIENLKAATDKLRWEGANAQAQNKELLRRRTFYERILSTTQFTVALAMFTLIAQVVQFGYTAWGTRKSDEEKQWKETVKSVSFDDEAKAISSALALETFFDSKAHQAEAKAMVAVILPYLKNDDAFDHVFVSLLRRDGWEDPCCRVYVVAQSVAVGYAELADVIYGESQKPVSLQGKYHELVSEELINSGKGEKDQIDRARQIEWQIDTITHGLIDFWRKHGTKPPGVPEYSADLQQIILREDGDFIIDLSGVDFGNAYLKGAYLRRVRFSKGNLSGATLTDVDLGEAELEGVRFDGAKVDNANFENVQAFANSSWKGVQWWKAAALSGPLCEYLKHNAERPPSAAALVCGK
jgi:hypothetical protein